MRTTLTLDDDVAAQLSELSHQLRKPFKVVVNETLRQGLTFAAAPTSRKRFRVIPFNTGLRAGIDPTKLTQFADELETEAVAEKMRENR